MSGRLLLRVPQSGASRPIQNVVGVERAPAFDQNRVHAPVQAFAKPMLAELKPLLYANQRLRQMRASQFWWTGRRGFKHPASHIEIEKRLPRVPQVRHE